MMRCEIQFLPSNRRVSIEAGAVTLLEATRQAGLPIASACGENGACALCGLQILKGAETLEAATEREQHIKKRNRIAPEFRLACRVRPRGDLTVRASYW
jgi:ferredoxin